MAAAFEESGFAEEFIPEQDEVLALVPPVAQLADIGHLTGQVLITGNGQPIGQAEAENAEGFEVTVGDEDLPEPQEVKGGAKVTEDPVKDYLKAIGKVSLLTADDEVELSKRIEAGLFAEFKLDDEENQFSPDDRADLEWVAEDGRLAKSDMLEANLRLVVSLAKRYTNRGLSFLEVIQEGNLGLIRAVEKFDYTKGYKFSTYATWWIRQAITRGLADKARTIRVPVHALEVVSKLNRVERQLMQDLGREPTVDELAAELSIDPKKVEELQQIGQDPISLQAPVGEDDRELGDFIEDEGALQPDKAAEFTELQEKLQNVLDTLSPREALIVNLRFGLTDGSPKTLDEVGKALGVTRERIRQLEKQALSKLKHPSRAQVLVDFYE